MAETILSAEDLIAQIPAAEINSSLYEGIQLIEIHCSQRRQHTTPEEKELLRANGWVEMFNQLIVGWDMWAKPGDFPNRYFPEDI